MPITLDGLPFDILFYITSHIHFDDIINLGHTCRQLKTLLQESTLCRRTVETHFPHAKETKLAQDQRIPFSFCDALGSIHDRRNAFAKVQPFSAHVIGYGNAFCYRQGVLCVLEANIIRVSDVHASSDVLEIDLSPFATAESESSASSSELKISLLYYSDHIITLHYERKGRSNTSHILALSTKRDPPGGKRVVQTVPLEYSHKLFSRHTAEYLYYGTYSAIGHDGHHEWEIRGISLDGSDRLTLCTPALQLAGFFGTDIGSTIAFEIHKEHFYAVSNQTSFEVEEIDWTSFYHCIRFPLDNPEHKAMEFNKKVYRRQHIEGPIHDSWTDLTLQFDEFTNKAMIVESRREWQKSSSRQLRSFYISDFQLKPQFAPCSAEDSPELEASSEPLLPYDDPFTDLLDSSNNPNYAPLEARYNWKFHPEFPPNSSPARSFILARTKFRAYNYTCSTFLDLVEDERCCNDPSAPPCLRIRAGSRRVAPFDWAELQKVAPPKTMLVSPPTEEDDVAYRHSTVRMWPPPASTCPCAKRLHDILNPALPSGPAYNRSITGVLDERSLVYMIRPKRSYGPSDDNALGVIVMINFNRGPLPPSSNKGRSCDQVGGNDNIDSSYWKWTPGACTHGICR